MLRSTLLLVVSLVVSLPLISTKVANACQCGFRLSPAVLALFEFDVIIVGELVAQDPNCEPIYPPLPPPNDCSFYRNLTFRVIASWKGITDSEVEIVTEAGGGSCGFSGEIGDQYLLYVSMDTRLGQLRVSGCTSEPIDRAVCYIEALDVLADRIQSIDSDDPSFLPEKTARELCGTGIFQSLGFCLILFSAFRCFPSNSRHHPVHVTE